MRKMISRLLTVRGVALCPEFYGHFFFVCHYWSPGDRYFQGQEIRTMFFFFSFLACIFVVSCLVVVYFLVRLLAKLRVPGTYLYTLWPYS